LGSNGRRSGSKAPLQARTKWLPIHPRLSMAATSRVLALQDSDYPHHCSTSCVTPILERQSDGSPEGATQTGLECEGFGNGQVSFAELRRSQFDMAYLTSNCVRCRICSIFCKFLFPFLPPIFSNFTSCQSPLVFSTDRESWLGDEQRRMGDLGGIWGRRDPSMTMIVYASTTRRCVYGTGKALVR
jgi:hypothetical protein